MQHFSAMRAMGNQTEQSHQTKGLIRLTMACNERCPFCNVPMEDYEQKTPAEDEVLAQVDALVRSGARTATISGGEPTLLRKRLLALVLEIRARDIPFVELQTNAVLVDSEYAEALAAAGVSSAFVSLLSHVPEHHDFLCGLDGAFERCLSGIDAMLDAGMTVTLNPVTAKRTQSLVAQYVNFVAQRLPRVRSISLSAVQPHGRAAENIELMPEYEVLRAEIPKAAARAEAHGIRLLNPYCGLPLCVGWSERMTHSVEAQEALLGQWTGPHGVDNLGNKRHGSPCVECSLRTRCGGAWHAYWDARDGSGLRAPEVLRLPWRGPWEDSAFQSCTEIHDVMEGVRTLRSQEAPTRWVISGELTGKEVESLVAAGATDWVWRTNGEPESHKGMLAAVRSVLDAQRSWPEQVRCRFVWWISGALAAKQAHRWVGLAHAMGISRVVLKGSGLEPSFWDACTRRYTGMQVESLDGG